MAAPRRPRLPRLRSALTVAAAALALVVLGAMTLDLLRKRNLESLVRSDNVQWNLSQLEVEFLRLENAVIVLIGNEDVGQMSAWYVMSALGFYQVTPGDIFCGNMMVVFCVIKKLNFGLDWI